MLSSTTTVTLARIIATRMRSNSRPARVSASKITVYMRRRQPVGAPPCCRGAGACFFGGWVIGRRCFLAKVAAGTNTATDKLVPPIAFRPTLCRKPVERTVTQAPSRRPSTAPGCAGLGRLASIFRACSQSVRVVIEGATQRQRPLSRRVSKPARSPRCLHCSTGALGKRASSRTSAGRAAARHKSVHPMHAAFTLQIPILRTRFTCGAISPFNLLIVPLLRPLVALPASRVPR